MTDITMCVTKDCPLKDDCRRFQAIPSEWQSYAAFQSYEDMEGIIRCDYFLPISGQ